MVKGSAKTNKNNDNKNNKNNKNKWITIVVVVLLLALASMVISGVLKIFISGSGASTITSTDGNIALIRITGMITTQPSSGIFNRGDYTSSEKIVEFIDEADSDPSVKGIIFEINSPGGSGVAADEISSAIKSTNKTTVSYVRDIGTSAAYWIASSTDKLYSNKLSFVGSIGAIASFIEFSGLMDDYNVTYQRFVAGKYKDFGVPYRKPSEEEKEMFQRQLDAVHEVFIQEVADNRNMSVEDVKDVAHGMFFTGMEAKDLGLIDEFGGKKDALEFIEQKLNITADIKEYKIKTSFLQALSSMKNSGSYNMGRGIGDSIVESSNPSSNPSSNLLIS